MFAVDGPDIVVLYTVHRKVLLPTFSLNGHALRGCLWVHHLMWSYGYQRKDSDGPGPPSDISESRFSML